MKDQNARIKLMQATDEYVRRVRTLAALAGIDGQEYAVWCDEIEQLEAKHMPATADDLEALENA